MAMRAIVVCLALNGASSLQFSRMPLKIRSLSILPASKTYWPPLADSVAKCPANSNFSPAVATWTEHVDQASGRTFYYNIATHERAWNLPTSNQGAAVNYEAVAADLRAIMDDPSWDDGSLAPVLIRLAWHSSGTYDASTRTGGSNNGGRGGATMRFGSEASDPENAGLDLAQAKLEGVKAAHPGLSYADLWVLASYVAIEHTGGPKMTFVPGRKDAVDGSACPHGDGAHNPNQSRLPPADVGVAPDAFNGCPMFQQEAPTIDAMKGIFGRMNLSDREMVALICGGHVYGRCHIDRSGYAGPWVEEMTMFSNEYAGDLIGDKWVEVTHDSVPPELQHEDLRPIKGNRQYVSLGPLEGPMPEPAPVQMMLISDMALLWVNEWRYWVEYYADEDEGEERLQHDFGLSFKRLTELGFQPSADVCPFEVTTAPPGWQPSDAPPSSPSVSPSSGRDYSPFSYSPRGAAAAAAPAPAPAYSSASASSGGSGRDYSPFSYSPRGGGAAVVAPPAQAAYSAPTPAPAAQSTGGPHLGSGGMADTRDPEAFQHEDARKSISVAPSFEEYMKQRT